MIVPGGSFEWKKTSWRRRLGSSCSSARLGTIPGCSSSPGSALAREGGKVINVNSRRAVENESRSSTIRHPRQRTPALRCLSPLCGELDASGHAGIKARIHHITSPNDPTLARSGLIIAWRLDPFEQAAATRLAVYSQYIGYVAVVLRISFPTQICRARASALSSADGYE